MRYIELTQEQQHIAVNQYLYIRTVEEELSTQEYLDKYNYTIEDIIKILKEKEIKVIDNVVYIEI